MHESRMIAEVCPPGCCAIEKVRGSRIATPLAPPRPGSTPMITPRTTPASISTRLNHESATWKPPIRLWISCIAASGETEGRFERALRQRDLEPDLEHQEEGHDHPDADGGDGVPLVLAEVAHENGDEERRGHVDAEREPRVVDERHVHDAGHQDGEDHPELAPAHERLAALLAHARGVQGDDQGRDHDEQADVEREVSGLRPVVRPARADPPAVPHHHGAEHQEQRRHDDFPRADRSYGPFLRPLLHAPFSSGCEKGPRAGPRTAGSISWRGSRLPSSAPRASSRRWPPSRRTPCRSCGSG